MKIDTVNEVLKRITGLGLELTWPIKDGEKKLAIERNFVLLGELRVRVAQAEENLKELYEEMEAESAG